jgi:3-phytase
VSATVETPPVPHAGDAADDPAVWANTNDPASSAVVATDKLGGLLVYDMAGNQLQYLAVGKVNNVDVRPTAGTTGGLTLSGRPVVLAVAGNRSNNTIRVYELDPVTRQLRDVAARTITPGITLYGSCLYRSAATGRLSVFVTSKTGQVEQWELFDNGASKVDAARVRSFTVGSQIEGCVADDELGSLYIGEELVGIWKYGAEPTSGTARTSVATGSSAGPLVPQVEGLSIAYGPNGTGYLVASSQGNSSYAVYRREGANDFVKAFRVVAGGAIDGAEGTDGLDVSTAPLGPNFPFGALVVQDGSNDSGNQNFKFVPWERVFPG